MITVEHGIGHLAVFDADLADGFYNTGLVKPNYPMPAIPDAGTSLIAWLWVNAKRTKRNDKKLMQWYLALCFDKRGHYIG